MKMNVVKLEMHSTSVSESWAGSTRSKRLPPNWSQLREKVISRASHRCESNMKDGSRCTDKGTDVDHINPGDDHSLENLQLLCTWHHGKKSSREGNTARVRLSEKRPKESHPGLV